MSLFTVTTTGGAPVEVYAALASADAYINDMIGSGAVAYRALVTAADADSRKRLLIAATRLIDRKRWRGTANGFGGTTLAFPRDGLSVSNEAQLALVSRAVFELMAILVLDSTTSGSTRNVKREKTRSIEREYFQIAGADEELPEVLLDLLGQWLVGDGELSAANTVGAPSSTGTCGNSSFDKRDTLKRREPL